jgi:hypothetical protein
MEQMIGRALRALALHGRNATLATLVVLGGCAPSDERPGPTRKAAPAATNPPAASGPQRTAAAPHVASPTTEPRNAEEFWTEFRDAALAGDLPRLLPLVRFPFTTRGMFDEDPVLNHSREDFPRLFARLLESDTGLREDLGPTMRELMVDTPRLPPQEIELSATGWFRVGDFEFKRVNGEWKFVHAYID